ncbi:Thiamine-monophosphate kinase [Alphaproteobacteria bacterium SO-S41]|nr:Thiamine-monophosphate kinase [Alphaproteobacteria bacterium SO-S41]
MSGQGEFALIARHFAPLTKGVPLAFGLTDDAAMLKPRKGQALVVTADAIVEGVHYLPDDPPETIARKLLRVNLSDLAAKGATPRAYLLTAAFPRDVKEPWIAAFARGLKQDQAHFGVHLLGGDTVATPGPATFSLTAIGEVPGARMLRRSGARPGDLVCVSGTIGDGGFGLAELRQPHPDLTDAQRRFLIARYRIPQPRTRLGPSLLGLASAALDVSDGLIQDLGHIARQSGVGLSIDAAAVPLSPAGLAIARGDPPARLRALSAGDDYEIAFTVPKARLKAMEAAAAKARIRVSVIGRVMKGQGVTVLGPDGTPFEAGPGGFDHFGR